MMDMHAVLRGSGAGGLDWWHGVCVICTRKLREEVMNYEKIEKIQWFL
jgi:hypothetical protein